MNNKILIKEIARRTNKSEADAAEFLNAFTGAVVRALDKGDFVTISKFGRFEVITTLGRVRINPYTREEMFVPTKNRVRFRGDKEFVNKIN